MIDVNIRGVLHGIHAVLPALRRNHGGHVINIASIPWALTGLTSYWFSPSAGRSRRNCMQSPRNTPEQLRDVGAHAIRFDGRKTGGRERFTPLLAPLASDLRELKLATGRRSPSSPVFAAHDGQHWQPDDYRNWRRRVWQGWVGGDTTSATCVHAGDRVCKKCGAVRCTPLGSRPRDLRGSYVTLRAYEGVPLTTIGKEVGGSVAMLDRHYAGVLANWHGKLTPAVDQIAAARAESRLRQEAP
jgi:hypothetical protein